jgi:hypothetical protein
VSCNFNSLRTIDEYGPRFNCQLNDYHTVPTYGKFCLTPGTHAEHCEQSNRMRIARSARRGFSSAIPFHGDIQDQRGADVDEDEDQESRRKETQP